MKTKCINFLFDSWCFELFDGRSFLVCHLVSVLRPCFSLRYISHFSSFYTIYETWFLHPTSDWQYFDLQINLGRRPLYSVASCHQRPRWDCFPSDSSFIFCKVTCFSFICVSHIFPSWLVGIVYFYCMRSVLCGTPWIIAKELKHQSMPMKNWSKKDSYCLPPWSYIPRTTSCLLQAGSERDSQPFSSYPGSLMSTGDGGGVRLAGKSCWNDASGQQCGEGTGSSENCL